MALWGNANLSVHVNQSFDLSSLEQGGGGGFQQRKATVETESGQVTNQTNILVFTLMCDDFLSVLRSRVY
jgi:hypothetical protein